MNVYDFDNTILRGESTARFVAYCLRHYPSVWPGVPAQAVNGLLFVLKLRKKQDFKQRMLGGFLRRLKDVDGAGLLAGEFLPDQALLQGDAAGG